MTCSTPSCFGRFLARYLSIATEELTMSNSDQERDDRLASCSRRAFLQRTSLLGGMIALGGGSYLYNPNGSFAADPIKVGIATDLTGPISLGGIPNANVAKMVVDEINASGGVIGR